MQTLHKIPTVQVLVVGDVVEWATQSGPRRGTVRAVGDNWYDVSGYWFCGDSRERLRRVQPASK